MQTPITSSVFQDTIEKVERLPVDDQLLLIEIIRQRMIQFEFVDDPTSAQDAIHLLALGTHDEVY
jgi:hypothetical protein